MTVTDDHLVRREERGLALLEKGGALVECVHSIIDSGEIVVIAVASNGGVNSPEYKIKRSNPPAFSDRYSYEALSGALLAIASNLGRREKLKLRRSLVNLKPGEEIRIGRAEET